MKAGRLVGSAIIILMVLIVIAACQQESPAVLSTVTSVAIETSPTMVLSLTDVPTSTPTPRPTSTFTLTPMPTLKTTQAPTDTQTPIFVPSPMPPTSTPSILSIRRPSREQLRGYLKATSIVYYDEHGNVDEKVFDSTVTSFFPFSDGELLYHDVNSDGEEDILLQNGFNTGFATHLTVLIWNETHYAKPFAVVVGNKYGGYNKISFEDWTNDGLDELILESRHTGGGSNLLWKFYATFVFQCIEECRLIWLDQYVAESLVNPFFTEISRTVSEIKVSDNPLQFVVEQNSFTLPYLYESVTTPLKINPVSVNEYSHPAIEPVRTFLWDGKRFEADALVSPKPETIEIASTQRLVAEGILGTVSVNFGETLYNEYSVEYYLCSAEFNQTPIGEPFKCNPWFTQIWWQDVLGDGQDEIVVSAVFEGVQSMFVWQKWGNEFRPIANIEGDIIRADLYGTRLENVDDDPELEILAGRWEREDNDTCYIYGDEREYCWIEQALDDLIYEWDGWEYIQTTD